MLLKFSKAHKNMQSPHYFFSNQKGPDSGAYSLQLPSPDSFGGTSQLTAIFASVRDQLQFPLGHLLPTEQLTWTETEKSSHSWCTCELLSLRLHFNCYSDLLCQTHYFWFYVSQPRSWAHADQGSQRRLCSKSVRFVCWKSLAFWEPAKNNVSEGMYNTAKIKLMNVCIIEFGCRMRVKFRTV